MQNAKFRIADEAFFSEEIEELRVELWGAELRL
jgi:hypothetical protein